MKAAWTVNREAVLAMRDTFMFKVPVELLLPSNPDDDEVVSAFRLALIDICAARNNNAQLTTEAKANQRGFYEEIRKRLPKEIADRVEWKSNEWGSSDSRPIKVRDIIALAWIPLTVLNEAGLLPTKTENDSPLNFVVPPQNRYSNTPAYAARSMCSRLYRHSTIRSSLRAVMLTTRPRAANLERSRQ
jgi:hypothetical protein